MLITRPVMLVTDGSSSHWYSKLQDNAINSLRWHISLDWPSSGSSCKWNVLNIAKLKQHSVENVPPNYAWAPEDAVIICFTSGTTGKPKGVTISHSALITQSLAKIAIVGYCEDDVYLHTAPLCHIGSLSSAMTILLLGGCHVLIPKFEAKSALEGIEQYHVTSLITVPAIMDSLLSLIRVKKSWKGKESMMKILNGGGGLSTELIKDAIKFFPRAKLLSAYGMTETCSSLTFMTLYDPTFDNPGSSLHTLGLAKSNTVPQPQGVCVGLPAPHVEMKICVDDSSHIGRILTRGPHTMIGYWNLNTSGTSKSSDVVWLDTGDIGCIDDYGYLWLIGRTNNRIKSGGENVYPEEVEAILLRHPGLTAIVVLSIPDAHLTEMVVACVQLRENWKWCDRNLKSSAENKELMISSDILRQYCRDEKLTRFKIPKIFILWRKPFPLTTTGKIRRDQVQREVMSQLQSFPSNL
ncbi:2-succinylbenzoate--CoA ligase, chloroplastic/peroxisomal isoform X2 [Tripterygium wilfordii]|nr:2-succinylbenzoate--CoA ligase, chloroplastic/peroxisomal isoform X2 [Tripterygium wilfordii]